MQVAGTRELESAVIEKHTKQRSLPHGATIIWLTCAMFFLFQPRILHSGAAASFMDIGTIVTLAFCVAVYIRRIRFDLMGGLAFAYLAAMLLSCVVNGGDPYYSLLTYGPFSAALLLAKITVSECRIELLWSIVFVTGAYTFLNLIVLCVAPIGDAPLHPDVSNTFLSYRNSFCRFYFPAIGASLLIDQEKSRYCSPLSLSLFAAALAQSILAYSATSILALLVFFIGICLITSPRLRRYLNGCTFVGAYFILFIGIVLLRLQNALSPATEALGRDATFTGRTAIWDLAISLINPGHLLLGYNGVPERILTLPSGNSVGTAHNALLDVMLWGGLIALCLVVSIVLLAAINLFRQRSDRSSAILSIYLGTFLLMGLVEFITCTAFFLFLGIADSWRRPNKGKKDAREKTGKHARKLPSAKE